MEEEIEKIVQGQLRRGRTDPLTILTDDSPELHGKYVALKKWRDNKAEDVIASGETPQEVVEKARERGYKKPMCLYVPKPGQRLSPFPRPYGN